MTTFEHLDRYEDGEASLSLETVAVAEAQPDPSHFVPESVDQLTTEMSLDDSPKRLDPVAHARGQLAQAAPTDPSALTTLDHETASLARQEREEVVEGLVAAQRSKARNGRLV